MYGILNTVAVTTDIFITSKCGDTRHQKIMRKTTKMLKHNVMYRPTQATQYITFAVYARFKSVNYKKHYKQKIMILVGAPTSGAPGAWTP